MGLATKGNAIAEYEMKTGVSCRSRLQGLSVNSQSSTYCFPQRDFLKAPNLWGACAGLARCGKSCRLRWINYLRPDLKRGNFTLEEEESIIKLHEQLGNKWSKIASHLPGRTDNEIKNVWNTHLKKRSIARGSKNHPPAKPNDSFTTSTSPTSGEKVLNDTIEFSSSSSTSCQMGKPDCCDDNGIMANVNKQDLLGEVIEIPFEPNLDVWEWLDVDSNCAEGYVLSSEAAAHQQRASDDDSSKGDNGRSWWFEYLENELGLGATTPDAYPDDMTDSALQKFLNEEELLSDPIRSFADMSTFT